jgi:hypothetical protein
MIEVEPWADQHIEILSTLIPQTVDVNLSFAQTYCI